MAVPPIGSSRTPAPPVRPHTPKTTPSNSNSVAARRTPGPGTANPSPPRLKATQGAPAPKQPAETGTAPASTNTTSTAAPQTADTASSVQKALADASAARQRIDRELAAGAYQGVRQSAPTEGDDAQARRGISLGRAEALVNRMAAARLYSQSSDTGLFGLELGQRIDAAGSAAEQEIAEIVERAQEA